MEAYERLIQYAAFDTASDSTSPTCPSTKKQLVLGEHLVKEMLALGITDANMDENGYVFGTIPATVKTSKPTIGFIAHMDVVNEVPSADIHPWVLKNYDGGVITLNEPLQITLSPEESPTLAKYVGDDLILTDGTTLLGADNKAGIAEIITMAERLIKDPSIPHGDIKIGFTPDEEIGRGAAKFDVKRFGADFAYTVDGAAAGEIDYETFNAATANIEITGISTHPGTAKNAMINAGQVAVELHNLLPPAERPEHTEGREGFFHLNEIRGKVEHAYLSYLIRDHDRSAFEKRKEYIRRAVKFMQEKYGEEVVALDLKDWYYNMGDVIKDHMHLVESARKAIEAVGETPFSIAARGGTDGSVLSFMGLPCPNLGTGSHNHHGRKEYASVQAMEKCVQILIEIAKAYA